MLRLGLAVAVGLMTASAAASPVAYDLSLVVDAEARRVLGHAQITVENVTPEPLAELWLWRYPERFAARSAALSDYNFYWIYPYRFNPGHMPVSALRRDGRPVTATVHDHAQAGPGTLLRVPLDPPLPPGAKTLVDVDYDLTVPRRFGAFGCVGGNCTLTGFYPMVAPLGAGHDATPGPGRYRLKVQTVHGADVVVNGALYPLARQHSVDLDLGERPGLTLLVGRPRLLKYERVVRGVTISLLSSQGRGRPSPPEQVLPYQPDNRIDPLLDTAAAVVELLAELGMPLSPGTELRLVEGALRIELAAALPGMVLVSDRWSDMFPLKRFLKFHEFEVARALFEEYVGRGLAGRERAEDLGWSPGVAASYLVDRFTLRAYRRAEFAREILAWASFIPAIDRVMYAPQVPFASAYFNTLEDPDPLRDSLAQFNNRRPTGKTLYAKLRDLLGMEEVERIVRLELDGSPLRASAEAIAGRRLDWFWAQWLGPYPKVDYRLGAITSRMQAGGFRHEVVVEKRGPNPPVEPVDLAVTDVKGHKVLALWDGHGESHTYAVDTPAPLSSVEIDPRGRLLEDLPGVSEDLKFNNRSPPRWKFIYNNFGGLLRFFPTLGLDLSLDFSLSRILDLRHALRFVLYRSESTQVGLTSSYLYAFGRKVTAARLTSGVSLTLTAARIAPQFGQAVGAGPNPGTMLAASVGWGYGDRLYAWEPRRELAFGASVGVTETILDNGRVLSQGSAGASWESIVPLADGHGLAMMATAALVVGDLKIARQMVSAGGAGALRGYDVESLLGRWRALGRLEYRHLFSHQIDINLAHFLYVHGIGGALFAEAAVVSPCESYVPNAESPAFDVGYSIRLFGDWFGVSQTTVNLDFAVPLARHERSCFGQLTSAAHRIPFGFFFSFGPPW